VVNANLFAKTEEHLAKHRLLHHITSAATASNDLAHALTTIVDGLSTALPGNRIMVLFRNDQGAYEVRASAGYEQDLSLLRVQPGEGIIGLAASEKRPVRVVDTESEPLYVPLVEGVRSEIAVPILFMDEVIGVLNIESEHPNAFDENDQEILGTLGNSLGAIIANARLITQVRQQTERQKQLFEITSRIRRSVDVNTILKTSAAELARVVQANRARIEITAGKAGLPQVDAPVIEQPAARKNGKSNGHHGPNGKHAQEAAE
jgi:GAF domain-containing protein